MTKLHVYKLVLASADSDHTNYQLFSFYNSSKTRRGIEWSLKKIMMDWQILASLKLESQNLKLIKKNEAYLWVLHFETVSESC